MFNWSCCVAGSVRLGSKASDRTRVGVFDQSPVCAEARSSRLPLSVLVRSPLALETIQELVHGE